MAVMCVLLLAVYKVGTASSRADCSDLFRWARNSILTKLFVTLLVHKLEIDW